MRVVKKPEERKAEMIAAASKLFAQQGFVRTSVAEIVTAVDVAKGLFYYYFTTKDDMVKAVVEAYCSYLGSIADEVAGGEGSAREKLERFCRHPAWEKCFTEPMLADLCLPQHAALYSDMCDRAVAHIGPAVERIASQALQESEKPEQDVHRFVCVNMYGVLMMARRNETDMDSAMEMFFRLLRLA